MYGVLGMNKRKPTGGIIATTSHFAKGVKEEIIELNLEIEEAVKNLVSMEVRLF